MWNLVLLSSRVALCADGLCSPAWAHRNCTAPGRAHPCPALQGLQLPKQTSGYLPSLWGGHLRDCGNAGPGTPLQGPRGHILLLGVAAAQLRPP